MHRVEHRETIKSNRSAAVNLQHGTASRIEWAIGERRRSSELRRWSVQVTRARGRSTGRRV